MTSEHGAGGLVHPVFRLFDPCGQFGQQSFDGGTLLYARLDGNRFLPTLNRTGSTRLASLRCERITAEAFGGMGLIASCTNGGRVVQQSWGYHHGPGPVVLPVRHLTSTQGTDAQSHLTFLNFGWVRADLHVWWLCSA